MCRLEGRGNGDDKVLAVQAVYAVEVEMNVIVIKRVCSVLSRVLLDRGEGCHGQSRLSTTSSQNKTYREREYCVSSQDHRHRSCRRPVSTKSCVPKNSEVSLGRREVG